MAALVGGPSLFSVQQALKEPPLLGSFSIGQLPVLSCGEREPTMMVPPPVCDSAVVPCLHGHLAFLQRHFPPRISSLPSSQVVSPQLPAILAQNCSPILMLQLPATKHSGGLVSLFRVNRAMAQFVRVAHTPFRLSQISCFILL